MKYELVKYSQALLEIYNPETIAESDSIEELEAIDTEGYGISTGFTIVENQEDGSQIDYYTGELFDLPVY